MKASTRKSKVICSIQMDISYYGVSYKRTIHCPEDKEATDTAVKNEDGYWYGLDLNGNIPVNVHIFFSQGMWKAYCESCEKNKNGGWNHWYDCNIICSNIKVKYRL